MKRLIFIAFIILIVASCKKDDDGVDDPKIKEIGTGKLTLLKGDNQSGVYGELLNDTIKLKITSSNREDIFNITYATVQGNGMVEHIGDFRFLSYYLDTAGTISLRWRMGCDNNQQKVRFYVFTGKQNSQKPFDHAPSDSITLSANAVKPNGWCKSCGYGFVEDKFTTKIIKADNSTLYLVNRGLFKSTDNGYNWYKVNGIPYSDEIVDAGVNSQNWLYVLTRYHGIHYTKDLQTWTEINNGILDMRDPTGFLVEDTALFVAFSFDGVYRTTNNGGFWRKLLIGPNSQRFYHFKRHPDHRIMLVDDWGTPKASSNNGDNWAPAAAFYGSAPFVVDDMEISPQGLIYVGGGYDATISEFDPVTSTGSFHSYYQWNGSSQHVNNITITPNDVYYLVNYNVTPGIYSKGSGWNKIDIGFNERIDYFYWRDNNKFVLLSAKFLYFKE